MCLQTITNNNLLTVVAEKHGNKGTEAAIAAIQMANIKYMVNRAVVNGTIYNDYWEQIKKL